MDNLSIMRQQLLILQKCLGLEFTPYLSAGELILEIRKSANLDGISNLVGKLFVYSHWWVYNDEILLTGSNLCPSKWRNLFFRPDQGEIEAWENWTSWIPDFGLPLLDSISFGIDPNRLVLRFNNNFTIRCLPKNPKSISWSLR